MPRIKKPQLWILGCAALLTLLALPAAASAQTYEVTITNLTRGRVHFPEENTGTVLKMEDGRDFTIFRWLKVDTENENRAGLTVFKVRFRFKNLSSKVNKRLSIIPAPFLMGMQGFREKIWTINESTNEFQGIYQWSTHKAAVSYPDSFIFRLMTKRAAPGTVSYEIIPRKDIHEYLKTVHIQ